jgi:hypothetical protein
VNIRITTLGITAFAFLQIGCKTGEPEGIAGLYLPDLNILFEDYDHADSTGNYAAFAHKLVWANRDLKSSELYVEAASLYQQAGNTDSVAYLLHSAIDHGMANPNILSRLNIPEAHQKGTAWVTLRQRLDSIQEKLGEVSHFSLELASMNKFWPYFERALRDTSRARMFFKEFIFSGPREIRDFYVVRYLSTDAMYGQMINASPRYYSFLREHFDPDRVLALKDITTEGMQRLRDLYPRAVFPRVYVVPGILNSGGTATEMGLFVGGDMYGKSRETPMEELTNWQQNAIMEVSSLPSLTLHELMHFQQNYSDPGNSNTVLSGLVQEGVCDFLVEICTGIPMKNSNLEYLEDPEKRDWILGELKNELFSDDLSKWLYNGGSIQDRPHDLGYTLGYLITKSYYNNQADKTQAVHELLNSRDFTGILRESDYSFLLNKAS